MATNRPKWRGEGPEVYWTDGRGGEWQVVPTWADLGDGRIECVGVVVRSFRRQVVRTKAGEPARTKSGELDVRPVALRGGPAPITRTLLKSLPLGQIIDHARGLRADFTSYLATAEGARALGLDRSGRKVAAEQAAELGKPRKRPGRPRSFTDDDFERLRQVYAEAHANNRKPTRAVAQAFSLSPSQAARRVHQARELGYLGPTSRGVAGGVVPKRRRSSHGRHA